MVHPHLSVALTLQLAQMPRFYGVRTGGHVGIYCMSMQGKLEGNVTWYKNKTMELQESEGGRITFAGINTLKRAFVFIRDLRIEDSGVYYCKTQNVWGPGTKLQVARTFNRDNAEYRSKMKDGLIVLQGLLLAVCIAAVVMRKQKLLDKRDSIYEEPETDHIYEGLAIETCGGGLYEELTVYAQADGAEAPWE